MPFSLRVSVIIPTVVEMPGKTYQYPVHEQFNEYQIGAYMAYTTMILYAARHHLAHVLPVFSSSRRSGSGPI